MPYCFADKLLWMTYGVEHHTVFIYVATPTAKQERLGHDINVAYTQDEISVSLTKDEGPFCRQAIFGDFLTQQKVTASVRQLAERGRHWNV